MDRGAWWAAAPGVTKSQIRLSYQAHTCVIHAVVQEKPTERCEELSSIKKINK